MASWLDRLRQDDIVRLDGGTGSELRRLGFRLDPAVWSVRAALDDPALLRRIHRSYIAAGAEIVTTNTFAATRFVLEPAGLADQLPRLVTAAVAAALRAREEEGTEAVAVAGAISCLPPRFDPTAYPAEAEEKAAYRELAERLAHAGVDLLALEMMEHPRHAAAAFEAARETGLPIILGLSGVCDGSGRLVAFDDAAIPLDDVLGGLLAVGRPDVVAIMHTPPAAVAPALEMVARRWQGPIGVYPELTSGDSMLTPLEFAKLARRWVASGARLLGGCCGTMPAHINALRTAHADLLAAR